MMCFFLETIRHLKCLLLFSCLWRPYSEDRLMRAFWSAGRMPPMPTRHNYRLVDYYPRPVASPAPRCGEHRDFGLMTLIFQDDAGGLEVFVNGAWQPVHTSGAYSKPNSAVCVFGWCARIRSNDRIAAVLHRVRDSEARLEAADVKGVVPRRNSAVLFVAPARGALLTPPDDDEGQQAEEEGNGYCDGILADDVYNEIARRWKKREGTLPELSTSPRAAVEPPLAEEKPITTQDDIIEERFRRRS